MTRRRLRWAYRYTMGWLARWQAIAAGPPYPENDPAAPWWSE